MTPEFVQDTLNFLQAATGWVMAIIPVAGGLAIGYHSLRKQMDEGNPQAAAQHNQAIKNVLIGSAVGFSALGLINVIVYFFGS